MPNLYEEIRIEVAENKLKLMLSIMFLTAILASSILILEDSDESVQKDFNRADVMFMNMMIVHHDQAIEMAELAESRTINRNILDISENISKAQRAENQQMTEWMKNLGFEPGNHHPMAGMASEEEIQRLRNSNGSEFNQLFAELMIEHHEGGIAMARNFYRSGKNAELREMQQQMIETQRKEIEKMEKWLREDQL